MSSISRSFDAFNDDISICLIPQFAMLGATQFLSEPSHREFDHYLIREKTCGLQRHVWDCHCKTQQNSLTFSITCRLYLFFSLTLLQCHFYYAAVQSKFLRTEPKFYISESYLDNFSMNHRQLKMSRLLHSQLFFILFHNLN